MTTGNDRHAEESAPGERLLFRRLARPRMGCYVRTRLPVTP